MKESLWLTTSLATAVFWGWPKAAQANDIALAFTLPPVSGLQAEAAELEQNPPIADLQPERLPVPTSEPPVGEQTTAPLPPPPPPLSARPAAEPLPSLAAGSPTAPPLVAAGVAAGAASGAASQEVATTAAEAASAALSVLPSEPSADLFAGGAESLVARAVGSAEGTRTPSGQRTAAYYGHRDPGNGDWNLGSFSYQHGAASPEEADARQLKRLQQQALELETQAQAKGLELSLAETLNGIDLANQAPLAALDRGYIDWLEQARSLGMTGEEAILYARTRAFLDPDTGRWNAPGLGNTVASISQDQGRRMEAITRAMGDSTASVEAPSASTSPQDLPTPSQVAPVPEAAPRAEAEAVDFVLSLDLP